MAAASGPRASARTSARGRQRRRGVAVAVAVVVVVAALAGGAAAFLLMRPAGAEVASTPTPDPSPTPTPTPLTPAEALLATTTDVNACVVSFSGDGIALDPLLQTQGALYAALPIPRQDGRVFAGWYASAADAAAFAIPARVNGAELVACTDREITLYGSWKTPEENAAENTGVPILMYHQFTTKPEGESGWLRGNYAYLGDFDAHMAHIADTGFYLPTWDELSAFIDGALFLPQHSVIITDDDADPTWLELAAPVVNARGLLTTSFVITAFRSAPTPNPYVLQRSHTHDMHRAGANGDGRMVNDSADVIAADLEQSAQILGAKEVVAYPFGHYNDTAKQGVVQAGFEMARTIEQGYVRIGTDKLALPCIRINYGMGLDALVKLIG
ncbi:polysaccharide deacetylase family protein [Microbacterium sp. RD1]|uniref:polysaccharide deacetylase family protein n=1 Tax=Microbacterium sp. RD1 TaxID=3457313 RepID=UPI003FA5C904